MNEYQDFGRLRGGFIGMVSIAIAGIIFMVIDVFNKDEEFKNKSLEREIKQKVIEWADKDSNGLSFSEDYKIKEMMDVQDSSKNYVLTPKDWEKAYSRIDQY